MPEFCVSSCKTFAIIALHRSAPQHFVQMQKCIWHGILCLHTNDIRQTSAASCEPRAYSLLHAPSIPRCFLLLHFPFPMLWPFPGVLFTLFFTIKHIFPVLCKIYSRDKHLRKVHLSFSLSHHRPPNFEHFLYIFPPTNSSASFLPWLLLLFISFASGKMPNDFVAHANSVSARVHPAYGRI